MTELEHVLENEKNTGKQLCTLAYMINEHKLGCNDMECEICRFRTNKDEILKILLSEHKEKPQLTDDEKVILRNIKPDYKYIARDKDGDIYAYQIKPSKNNETWVNGRFHINIRAFNHLFQFIKWEDEEPWKISDLLEE